MRLAYENGGFILDGVKPKTASTDSSKRVREGKGSHFYDLLSHYTVIDIETTGLYPSKCEIIEVAAVKVRDGKIVDTYESLIKPSAKVSYLIEKLTGITNQMLSDAPQREKVIPEYADFIGDDVVIGHNIASFDSCFLYDYFMDVLKRPFSNPMVDTLYFSKKCGIEPDDFKLTSIAQLFGVEYEAHRALNDCIANHAVYEKLKPLFKYGADYDRSSERHNRNRFKTRHTEETKALKDLSKIIDLILEDNVLSDDEIFGLREWMHENTYLAGNYPFDSIFSKIEEVLDDGIITEEERAELFELLTVHSDPVSAKADTCEDLDLTGKCVCLTGEFVSGTRNEITASLESKGVIVGKSITSKTDCLIVGGEGSTAWSCGNYGNKVKKALELQEKGKPISIIREDVMMSWLNSIK